MVSPDPLVVGSVHAALSKLNESVVLHASSPLELVSTLASIVKVSNWVFILIATFSLRCDRLAYIRTV